MGNGILAFTLGLEGGQFLNVANAATRSLKGLLTVAAGLGGITGGIFGAFTRGADLQRLHARTGEAVSDLFLLERGFKAVGIESDNVGQMLFHLQKGLTGVSDLGENTAEAFAIMGLSMADLRRMNAPQQMEAIAKAIRSLNASMSAGVAGKIFGREAAANFLQLARSGDAFTQALNDNAAAAAQMARSAAAFNQIELTIVRLKNKTQDYFTGLAEGAAPGIQRILDMLNKIDLVSLGQKFGDVISGFAQTIQDQKLGELLKLSLNAGLEGFSNAANAIIDALAAKIHFAFSLKGYENAVIALWAAKQVAFTGNAAAYDILNKAMKNLGFGALGGQSSSAMKALEDFIKTEAARSKSLNAVPDNVTAPGTGNSQAFKNVDFTSVEKMGFVFGSGGPTLLVDHARATAAATQITANNTGNLVGLMWRMLGFDHEPKFKNSTSAR